MGKKIALAVLLLLVVGGAVLQNIYISGATQKLLASLQEVQSALQNDDFSAAADAADNLAAEWDKEQKLFEALFEHKEVDSISASMKSLQSFCRSGAKKDALSVVSEASFYIEHIKGIDSLGWENVF